ncbi:hypothetical protein B0H12DRAFT_1238732 [Mycena haematopus]|nr:hypothetical protein B0H12DRAFT_1238732 [Mycena haematopus]
MPACTVVLIPRPIHLELGSSAWLPAGTDHGPFHPDHSLPAAATESLHFSCSEDLTELWIPFYSTIHPLLGATPDDSAAPPLRLYAAAESDALTLWNFTRYSLKRILKLFAELGYTRQQFLANAKFWAKSDDDLCAVLYATEFLSLSDAVIEPKIIVNMFSEAVEQILALIGTKQSYTNLSLHGTGFGQWVACSLAA